MTKKTINPEQLLDELLTLEDQITALGERRDIIRATLANLYPTGGTIGATSISVTHPRRLNSTLIAKAYPVTKHPELYKPTLDTKAVRHHIAEADLEPFMTVGAPQVRIR